MESRACLRLASAGLLAPRRLISCGLIIHRRHAWQVHSRLQPASRKLGGGTAGLPAAAAGRSSPVKAELAANSSQQKRDVQARLDSQRLVGGGRRGGRGRAGFGRESSAAPGLQRRAGRTPLSYPAVDHNHSFMDSLSTGTAPILRRL